MGGVLGIFYRNNGTLDVFYTNIMDFCIQARMVGGISHQKGSVALVISVSPDPTDHEPLAAGVITRLTLPIYFQVLETSILWNLFL